MAKADIWMPIYIGDYMADTMHLTTELHGAYFLLLMAYWRKGGALPSNDSVLMGICRMSPDAWSNAKAVLMQFFDTSDDSVWFHKRVEKELELAGARKEKASDKAKKAAEARWAKERECLEHAASNAQAMLGSCPSPSPSPKENTNTSKPSESAGADPCPHQAIVDLFHEVLPELARVRDITHKRQTQLRSRWRQDKRFQSLDWWRKYFSVVKESDFLMGRAKDWQADFDFLINASKFQKIIEGGYQNGGGR